MKRKNQTVGHTPGPWTVKPIKDGFHEGKAFIFGPQLDKSEYRPAPVVLLIDKPCKDKDEHAANMALISAAPELLERLEAVQTALEEYMGKDGRDENAVFNAATYAVIAKAKGQKI